MALVYPNAWRLGMANLGLHAVYRLVNQDPRASCERVFLPESPGEKVRSVESGLPLSDFDVVAFSLSFEEDYGNVLALLDRAGFPLRAADRDERFPLVAAGGIAVQMNPEPVAPFLDLFLVGEGEELVPPFLEALRELRAARPDRSAVLRALSRLPGAYVPSLYRVEYADTRGGEGWVSAFEPLAGAPERVRRLYVADLRRVATSRVVDSPEAQFGDLYLTEVARGCLWGCRFCAAGFVQRPYREVDLETLRAEARKGMERGMRVGLVRGRRLSSRTPSSPRVRYRASHLYPVLRLMPNWRHSSATATSSRVAFRTNRMRSSMGSTACQAIARHLHGPA